MIVTRLVAATPFTPPWTGVIEIRQDAAVCNRIVQRAVRRPPCAVVVTAQVPRTVRTARRAAFAAWGNALIR